MHLKDEFKMFLKKYRCLDWFEGSFNDFHGGTMSIDEFFENKLPKDYVCSAFSWGNALLPELCNLNASFYFWSFIEDEWLYILNQDRNKNES